MSDKLGKVYLTGAGCGGAELLTLRARELISACDCLVYDDLIDEGILALAPPEAELVHVGKRAGRHSMRQEEINRVLVECAGRFAKVVRLKGGDPFVFGRGGEEMAAHMTVTHEVEHLLRQVGVPTAASTAASTVFAVSSVMRSPQHTSGTPLS